MSDHEAGGAPSFALEREHNGTVVTLVVEGARVRVDARDHDLLVLPSAGRRQRPVRDANVPEQTDAWAWQLRDWRRHFVAPGSNERSVNRTLTEFGDEASPQALWGLRRVKLDAPLPSVQHVEVLGALGYRQPPLTADLVDADLRKIVLRASPAELGEALVVFDEAGLEGALLGDEPPVVKLAELLAGMPLDRLRQGHDRRLQFRDLLQGCLLILQSRTNIRTEVIAPPIPLPDAPGVRFLDTVGAILEEGSRMDHCVAARAPRALSGDSFLFHIDHADTRATAELGSDGTLLEVRGPRNRQNAAVTYATAVLHRWGAQLILHRLGAPTTSLWMTPAPPLPDGAEPIATVAALRAVLVALTSPPETGDEHVWLWAARSARGAVAGRAWLVDERAAGIPLMLWELDAKGVRVLSSASVREAARAAPAAGSGDDDDGDWDDRT
ncbi:MAG: hypothetical protein FJ137_14095 [Deltaproteobacteria bacterium]|nr:hypothetical protein [Deltaproteobacteria bacterium]